MFNFLKVLLAAFVVIGSAYLFARFSREFNKGSRRYFPSQEEIAANVVARKSEEKASEGGVGPFELDGGDQIDRFLNEDDEDRRSYLLRDELKGLEVDELGAVFEGAILASEDEIDALEAAAISLREIARQDPSLAISLLYAQAPYQKERLAEEFASGWAEVDPLSAWDWIESAWMDQEGVFMDRALQNQLSEVAMGVILGDHEDLAMAATLASMTNQPDLKKELVTAIASHIISEDPESALAKFEFEGDASVDVAIMDAVIGQWSERDLAGAVVWALENESEISMDGMRKLAKQTALASTPEAINETRFQIIDTDKQDVFIAEAARVLVRQDLLGSAQWIATIQSPEAKDEATRDALYELGYEDFDTSLVLLELAYGQEGGASFDLMGEVLKDWSEQDSASVLRYLNSGQTPSATFAIQLKAELGYE